MSNISTTKRASLWEQATEQALKNKNLSADIRINGESVEVNAPSLLQRLKAAMWIKKAPTYASREETLINLREQFTLDFSQKLRKLIQETGIKNNPQGDEASLITHAMQSFEVITQQLEKNISNPSISTSQAIRKAHQGSLTSFGLLREKFAQPQLTPQFCKTGDGKWSVLQPAPNPENLVFSGGGVKGAGYIGWVKAAEQFGILKSLKRIAGSSAGAMIAAMIAAGMSAEDVEAASNRTSFWKILTGTSSDPVVNKATKLDSKGWFSLFGFSGTYAVNQINGEIVGSIKNYFNSLKQTGGLDQKIKDLQLEEADKQTLLALEKEMDPPAQGSFGSRFFSKKPQTHMVSFAELAALTKIDPRFKELTVTGYNVTKKEEVYYSAEKSPKQFIAEAVRISMSMPGIFDQPVDPETGDSMEDGGVGSNTPSEVFVNKNAEEEALENVRAKTLVLGFDNNGRFYDITNHGKIHEKVAMFSAELSGNPNFQKDSDEDAQKLYDAGPNALMVSEGNLTTMNFMASKASLDQAKQQAETQAVNDFSMRQNQAVASNPMTFPEAVSFVLKDHAINSIFTSLQEAMKTMGSSELEDIIFHYASKSDETNLLSQANRQTISAAAQAELAARI